MLVSTTLVDNAEDQMKELNDAEFIQQISDALKGVTSLRQATHQIGWNYNATYDRIRRLGYELDVNLSLKPIHAPSLDNAQHGAA